MPDCSLKPASLSPIHAGSRSALPPSSPRPRAGSGGWNYNSLGEEGSARGRGREMKVAEILNRKGRQVFTIGVEQTALDAVRQLVERNVGSLVVLGDNHKLVGIVTERDILRECNRRFALLDKTRVEEVMSTDVLTGTPQDDIGQVLGLMTERRVRHLPIVDRDQVVGMVSIGDVGKQIQHACEVENADLKDLITGHYVSAAE